MHVLKIDYQSNPNVGLFGFANDKFCLVGIGFKKKIVEKIEKVLKVPVYQITLCRTDLVGVFCTGNNECILVPSIVSEDELKELDRICKEVGMRYEVVSTELTALSNNILCNDLGALVNPEFSARVKKQIRQALRCIDSRERASGGSRSLNALWLSPSAGCGESPNSTMKF